ncbi:MAG: right-handed parallel beta-helix repeat-containing protein, partial [Polyangiaceae bacterium]
ATCLPIGDCNAAFPPANATLFVNGAFTAGQIDATHFVTVDAALASATSGAVIAVESGTYTGRMVPSGNVSVVGRCAEKVVFQAADSTTSAIEIERGQVAFSNMTLRDYHAAVSILGGNVTLDSMVVEGSHFAGIVVGNTGTTANISNVVVRGTRAGGSDANAFGLYIGDAAAVTVTGSAFADNDYINVGVSGDGKAGAKLTLTGSVVRNGHAFSAAGGFGWGIYGSNKISLDVEQSAIVDNTGFGLQLNSTTTKTAAQGKIVGSVVRGTALDPVNGVGIGIEGNRSVWDIEQTTVSGSNQTDLYMAGGTSATITGSTLLGTSSADAAALGPLGIIAIDSTVTLTSTSIFGTRAGAEFEGATIAEVDDSLITQTRTTPTGYYADGNYVGVGLFMEEGATLTSKNLALVGTHTAGMITLGNTTATNLLIEGTRAGGDGVAGRGISAQKGSVLTLQGAAIRDNAETGIAVAQNSVLNLSDSIVDTTSVDPSGKYGIGILLLKNDSPSTITTTTLRHGQGSALAASASGARVTKSAFLDNSVGVYVQDGASLVEGNGTGDPMTVAISSDTVFDGNATRVGSGAVPLPEALVAP